jgi:hypothetical protein
VAHAGLQHLIGVETRIRAQQRPRQRRDQRLRAFTDGMFSDRGPRRRTSAIRAATGCATRISSLRRSNLWCARAAGGRIPARVPPLATDHRTGNPRHRYLISSSAVARSVSGTSMPSALAVLRFTTISNLVGCWTGRSGGFSPKSCALRGGLRHEDGAGAQVAHIGQAERALSQAPADCSAAGTSGMVATSYSRSMKLVPLAPLAAACRSHRSGL